MLAVPGVVAVLTPADIPGVNDIGPIQRDDPILAERLVEFAGQPIFAVCATSVAIARRAAAQARIDIAPLPALLTIDAALAAQSYVLPPVHVMRGDAAGALAAAPRRLGGRFACGGQDHFYLEGQVALAIPQERGGMDEPTSVLTPQAVLRLFDTLKALAAEGCSILYISHKLDEIRAICHRATVLRGGKVTGTCDPRTETNATLARMMIGGELPRPHHREQAAGSPALVVDALDLEADDPFGTTLRAISITVHAGEIVGIAGVSGNGQKELLAALSGERTLARAQAVTLCGKRVGKRAAYARRRLGLSFVPEERLGRGAVPEMTLADNALLTTRDGALVSHGFIRSKGVRAFAAKTIARYGVKATGPDAVARSLSGGNLQKFIVGREINQRPKVLIAAQPTWGVDVGAAAQIRQALIDLRDGGVAVLVISEELDELMEICDRLAVIAQGRLSPAKPIQHTSAEEIGILMAGTGEASTGDSLAAVTE